MTIPILLVALAGLLFQLPPAPVQEREPDVHYVPTPQKVVDVMCDHFLSVPVSDDARASLEKFLTEDLSPGEEFSTEGILAGRKLIKLAHLILSLPEAQLG